MQEEDLQVRQHAQPQEAQLGNLVVTHLQHLQIGARGKTTVGNVQVCFRVATQGRRHGQGVVLEPVVVQTQNVQIGKAAQSEQRVQEVAVKVQLS